MKTYNSIFTFLLAILAAMALMISCGEPGNSSDDDGVTVTDDDDDNNDTTDTCGNGVCDDGESVETCSQDCDEAPPETCGNSICDDGEDLISCFADCDTEADDPPAVRIISPEDPYLEGTVEYIIKAMDDGDLDELQVYWHTEFKMFMEEEDYTPTDLTYYNLLGGCPEGGGVEEKIDEETYKITWEVPPPGDGSGEAVYIFVAIDDSDQWTYYHRSYFWNVDPPSEGE